MTRIGDKYDIQMDANGKVRVVKDYSTVDRGLDVSTRIVKRDKRKNGQKIGTRAQARSINSIRKSDS